MLSFADSRNFELPDERLSRCLFCGKELVVLPDDRRGGACYDCLSLSIRPPAPCPSCGVLIPGEERAVGCANCRWYPLRD
jgi:hypothetical protein